jgi:hypothetical protein
MRIGMASIGGIMDTKEFEQIFLSYNHSDISYMERIFIDLQNAGIRTWHDAENTPGTPDFELSTRSALHKSCAVIYLASPKSLTSQFVQGELRLAKTHQIPIIPVWIWGENWEDCVPVDFMRATYFDCREEAYEISIRKLIQLLYQTIDRQYPFSQVLDPSSKIQDFRFSHSSEYDVVPGYYTIIQTPSKGSIAVRVRSYSTMRHFVEDFYVNYLKDDFSPYTYGKEWIFVRRMNTRGDSFVCLLPWQWLQQDLFCQPLIQHNPEWADQILHIENGRLFYYDLYLSLEESKRIGHWAWTEALIAIPMEKSKQFGRFPYLESNGFTGIAVSRDTNTSDMSNIIMRNFYSKIPKKQVINADDFVPLPTQHVYVTWNFMEEYSRKVLIGPYRTL